MKAVPRSTRHPKSRAREFPTQGSHGARRRLHRSGGSWIRSPNWRCKLDPKSIGVGQYQHDVDQGALKRSLDDVVVSCVNGVGVELNTASKQLLAYVSGLGPALAENIVNYRNENGSRLNRAPN